jgi:DNA-binding NarL/FixJ family response regulator
MPIRIILAEEHDIVRMGLRFFLSSHPGIMVVGECGDGDTALQIVRIERPDILILETRLPRKDGLAVLHELRQTEFPIRVILLVATIIDEYHLLEAMRLGVNAVISKEASAELLAQCIHNVHAGEQLLIGSSFSQIMEKMMRYKVHAGSNEKTKPVQIFLCHASEDRAAVLSIYDQLRDLGYKPWVDKRDLFPGQRWRVEIPKAIKASSFIIIFLSKASVVKRGYVQKEFKLALEVLDEMPEETIYIIPVRLDDCPVPNQFSHLHWCNYFEPSGLEEILRSLQYSTSSDAPR